MFSEPKDTGEQLFTIAATGGEPVPLSRVDLERGAFDHSFPAALPDADTLLITQWTGGSYSDSIIASLSLESGDVTTIIEGGADEHTITDELAANEPQLSPDGQQIVFSANQDIWRSDSGGSISRVTAATVEEFAPVWMPDGQGVVFGSYGGTSGLAWAPAAGGDSQVLSSLAQDASPRSWLSGGAWLAFDVSRRGTGMDVGIVTAGGDEQRFLMESEFHEASPAFSPVGSILAFGGIHLTGPVERRSSPGAICWRAFQARRVPAYLRRRGSHSPGPPGGD